MPDRYLLSPKAEQDLENIWLFGVSEWSLRRAETYVQDLERIFELVAGMPEIGLERTEFILPVRTFFHASHVVLYQASKPLEILRVVHQSSDWQELQDFDVFPPSG